MNKQDLKSKIEKLEKGIASKVTPENLKASLKSQKEKFEKELVDLEKKEKSDLSKKIKDLKASVKTKSTKSGLSRDGARKAKKSGKRIAEDGSVYYEKRANRTDSQTDKKPYLEKGGETEPFSKTGKGEFVSTEDRLNSCSQELYNKNYADCDREQRDKAFNLFLKKYAISHSSRKKMADGGKLDKDISDKIDQDLKFIVTKKEKYEKELKELKDSKSQDKDTITYLEYELESLDKLYDKLNKIKNQSMAKGGDLYDDMDEDIVFANKKAKMIANSLKGMGYNIVEFTEADYDADANISLSENVNVNVDLEGELAIVTDEGDGKFLFMDCGKSYATVLEKLKKLEDKGLVKRNIMDKMEKGRKTPRTIKLTLSDKDSYDYTYKQDGTTGTAAEITFGFGKEPFQYEVKKISKSLEPLKQDILDAFTIQGIKQHEYKGGFSEAIKHLDTKVVYEDNFAGGGFTSSFSGTPDRRRVTMAEGGYVVVEGFDHYKNKPLYQVISKDENSDYVGEWHDSKEDAENELQSLSNDYMAAGGKIFKREKFVPTPIKEGDTFLDRPQAKSGYYNYRIVRKIDGKSTEIQVVDTFNNNNYSKGNPYTVPTSYVQNIVDEIAKEKFDEQQDIKEGAFNLSKEIGADKAVFRSGDLKIPKVRAQLYATLKNLASVQKNVSDSSVGAAPNSMTFRASQSGTAISVNTNNVHRGGYYDSDIMYILQVQVGGAISYKNKKIIMIVLENLLSKYTFTTELGTSKVRTSDGTNWSSVMLTAPSSGKSYIPLKELDSFRTIRSMEHGGYMADGGVTKPRLDCVCTKTIKFTNGMNYFEKFTYGCTENYRGDGVSVSYEDGRFTTMSKEIFNKHFEYVNKMAKGGNVSKIEKIKDYYVNEFPTDDLGIDINSEATFDGLYKALDNQDVYEYIGVNDSLVRERVFQKLSEIMGVKYDEIYSKWLDSDYADGGMMADDGKLPNGRFFPKMADVGKNEKTINGYDIDYFKTGRWVYANIEIPSPNPTFDDDTQIKGFGKDEKEAFNDLKKEFEKYLKSKDKKMADGGSVGQNMYVFGYTTQNFDLCPLAVEEFVKAVDVIGQTDSDAKKTALSRAAMYVDDVLGVEKKAKEDNIVSKNEFLYAVNQSIVASAYNYASGLEVNLNKFLPMHIFEIATKLVHTDQEARKDELTAYDLLVAKDKIGEAAFKNMTPEERRNLAHEMKHSFEDGGSIEDSNYRMVVSQAKAIKHHADELLNVLTPDIEVEAWVVGKIERASTDLSDITHYIDGLSGENEEMEVVSDTYFAEGGQLSEKYNVHFNYNPSNLSNEAAEKIAEKYTKNWNHNNDFDEVSFYVLGLSKDDSDDLVKELKMEDTYNVEVDKSRYEKGGQLEKGVYYLGKPKKEGSVWAQKIVELDEIGLSFATDYGRKLKDFPSKDYKKISEEELSEFIKNSPKHQNVSSDISKFEHYAAGGMIVGRYYKDNQGVQHRYIGENSDGNSLFSDGEKVSHKSLDDFEPAMKETKLFRFFENGGETSSFSNARLLGRESQDFEKEAREYAGADWDKLSKDEKRQIISDLEKDFDRNSNFAKGGEIGSYEVVLSAAPNVDYEEIDYRGYVKFKPKKKKVKSIEDAQKTVRKFIEDNELGGGNWNGGDVYKDGVKIGYISYNGKFWDKQNMAQGGDLNGNLYKVHFLKVFENGKEGDTIYVKEVYANTEKEALSNFKKMHPKYKIEHLSKYKDGGYMAQGGELNKGIRKLAASKGFTPKALGKDYEKVMAQAVVEALTDSNFHNESRKLISLLENKPEWAKKPNFSELPRMGSKEYEEWRASSVYSSEYNDADEKTRDFAIKVSQISGYDGQAIANAFEYLLKMEGGYHKLANDIKKAMESSNEMAEGGETGSWKKNRTRKLKTKEEAEKAIKLFAQNMGKVGRNYKVEKMDDGYIISYESNFTDGMAEGGMTEHGLRIGDKVTTDMFWDNQIVVENQKTHKRAQINLETGKRKDEMAKGGEIGVFEKNQIKIAKDTLKMSNNGASLMGGMTKDEARKILDKHKIKYVQGGKVTFEDKVKAIKASLLKKKKVSPKVQKDYGKTYSPKEAEQSAKRIVGSRLKKGMK